MEVQERSGEEVDTISEDNEKCNLLHLGLWWTGELYIMYISNQGEIRQKALEKKRPTIFSLHMQTAIVSTPNVSENMCVYSAHNASVYNSLLSCKACGMWFLYDTRTFQCP